jgi:hypothetical protein
MWSKTLYGSDVRKLEATEMKFSCNVKNSAKDKIQNQAIRQYVKVETLKGKFVKSRIHW